MVHNGAIAIFCFRRQKEIALVVTYRHKTKIQRYQITLTDTEHMCRGNSRNLNHSIRLHTPLGTLQSNCSKNTVYSLRPFLIIISQTEAETSIIHTALVQKFTPAPPSTTNGSTRRRQERIHLTKARVTEHQVESQTSVPTAICNVESTRSLDHGS
jgi:hypothetical protein